MLWAFAARLTSPVGTTWRENRAGAGDTAACLGTWSLGLRAMRDKWIGEFSNVPETLA